jgi:hypothetical protein
MKEPLVMRMGFVEFTLAALFTVLRTVYCVFAFSEERLVMFSKVFCVTARLYNSEQLEQLVSGSFYRTIGFHHNADVAQLPR